jgi:hypothetical protein
MLKGKGEFCLLMWMIGTTRGREQAGKGEIHAEIPGNNNNTIAMH